MAQIVTSWLKSMMSCYVQICDAQHLVGQHVGRRREHARASRLFEPGREHVGEPRRELGPARVCHVVPARLAGRLA